MFTPMDIYLVIALGSAVTFGYLFVAEIRAYASAHRARRRALRRHA